VKQFLEMVNELLPRARASGRLFGISSGDNGRAVLLTQEMHRPLARLAWTDRMPWVPASERPSPRRFPPPPQFLARPRSEFVIPRAWALEGAPLSILQRQIGEKTLPPAFPTAAAFF
jgi:hypothetical protein